MNKLLTVSPSPHIGNDQTVKKLMYGVILSLAPAFIVSLYVFGIGALITTVVCMLACVISEMLIQKFILKTEISISDGSAMVTGLLLAFNLPSNLPWWMAVLGAVFAIGVGKMTFGGLGNNPFNPAITGRIFLLISFPVQMTSWPMPIASGMHYMDAATGATPLGVLKEAVRNGEAVPEVLKQLPDRMHLFLGQMGGSLGEISALALLTGFAWLLYKRIITWHIPVFMVATIFAFTGLLWFADPSKYAPPLFHILTGGVMLGAIYMATDLVTSPMTKAGMIIFAIGIGLITVIIRVFGSYPEGVSFAIMIMNAFVPLINKYIKPVRFGKGVKHG
jgi:Na+-translocating ferredoxin:NAD+ oxidoreductase subunit D